MTYNRQNMDTLKRTVKQARRQFERRQICPALLASLYQIYNPLPDVMGFVCRARELFPRLNCGLASIYLQQLLDQGDVVQGSYADHGHTFLLLNHSLVVDITADQFGGPKVYVGALKAPWNLTPACSNNKTPTGDYLGHK